MKVPSIRCIPLARWFRPRSPKAVGVSIAFFVFSGTVARAGESGVSPASLANAGEPVRFTLADLRAWQSSNAVSHAWVPALANSNAGHAACAVLEGLRHPDLGHALAQALSTAPPVQKAAILGVLGRRREAGAVAAIVPCLTDGCPAVAVAAARALGDIATADALTALEAVYADASATHRGWVEEAVVRTADRAWNEGRTDLVQRATAWLSQHAQSQLALAAATRFQLRVAPAVSSVTDCLELTRTNAPGAAGAVLWLRDDAPSNAVAEAVRRWDQWPPIARAALLFAEQRLRMEPPTALLRALDDPSDDVAALAIQEVADRNCADAIASLARLAARAHAPERARLAAHALNRMVGPKRREEIRRLVASMPDVRAVLLPRLGSHADLNALPILRDALISADGNVRTAAMRALESYPRARVLPLLLDLAETTDDPSRGAAIHETIARVVRQDPPEDPEVTAILARTRKWPTEKRRQALVWLTSIPAPAVGAELVALVSDAEPALATEAARALGRWANPNAWPDLAATLRRTSESSVRSALILAAIEIVRKTEDPSQRGSAALELLSLAREVSEWRTVLPLLSTVPDPRVLTACRPLLEKPEVAAAAADTLMTWIEQFGARWPEAAAPTAPRLIDAASNSNVVQRARAWLDAHRPSPNPKPPAQ